MVNSPAGSSDLFLIPSCTTSFFLYLSFSTLYSSSLWRTDTIVFAKLNKRPLSIKPSSNAFEINNLLQVFLTLSLSPFVAERPRARFGAPYLRVNEKPIDARNLVMRSAYAHTDSGNEG